jgi:hypothetical protein
MKPEAPTATVTLLAKRLKAELVVDETEPTLVLALCETLEGVEPSECQRMSIIAQKNRLHVPTNEAPHCDSRAGLEDETVEGMSVVQILYDALLQSVQVMLVGNELGGFWTSLTTFPRVSGPVTVSTLVRVSVTHRVFPLINEAACQFPVGSIVP